MSYPPNQYQRRQMKRHAKRVEGIAILITMALFYAGYQILQPHVTSLQYQQVLESNGLYTLRQIQSMWWDKYALPAGAAFFIVIVLMMVLISWLTRRKRMDFHFDEISTSYSTEFASSYAPTTFAPHLTTPRQINLARLSPKAFERIVAHMIQQRTGCTAQVVGGARDGGVDIRVYDRTNQRLVGVVQCKRFNPQRALPPKYIREMVDVKQTNRVNIAYLATTAYFTEESRQYARERGIRLIEGEDLKRIIKKVSAPMI